jgi:hypothetical protein
MCGVRNEAVAIDPKGLTGYHKRTFQPAGNTRKTYDASDPFPGAEPVCRPLPA